MKTASIIAFGTVAAASFAAGVYVGLSLDFNRAAAPVNPLYGPATAYDGDTLTIRRGEEKFSIRLFAADAPELRQTCARGDETVPCGRMARDAARALLAQGDINCEKIEDRDRYGRYVAVCFSADGTDIGGALVAQGLAVHYTDYTDGRYAAAEAAARRARRGLWGMKFQPPAEWRQCHAGPVAARPADCPAP